MLERWRKLGLEQELWLSILVQHAKLSTDWSRRWRLNFPSTIRRFRVFREAGTSWIGLGLEHASARRQRGLD